MTLVDVTNAQVPVTLNTLVMPIQVVEQLPDVDNNDKAFFSRANALLEKQGTPVPFVASVWKDDKGDTGSETEQTYVGLAGEAFSAGPQRVRLNLVSATLEQMDVMPVEGTDKSIELPRKSQQFFSQLVKFEPGKDVVLNADSDRRLKYRLRYKPAAL